MHRYSTRFATMNRSYFPATVTTWMPETDDDDTVVFNSRKRADMEDEEYFPEMEYEDDADGYDAYLSSTDKTDARNDCNDLLNGDAKDEDYEPNLRGWNTSMGRRPMTRSMTRSAPVMNARVASLRSSRR